MEFVKHTKYRSEKFGAVVFDTLNEKVYVTNETGNDILRLIDEGFEPAAIVERLERDYSGAPGQIKTEVEAFVENLVTAGLLSPGAEAGREE